jgi:hypothetical protein
MPNVNRGLTLVHKIAATCPHRTVLCPIHALQPLRTRISSHPPPDAPSHPPPAKPVTPLLLLQDGTTLFGIVPTDLSLDTDRRAQLTAKVRAPPCSMPLQRCQGLLRRRRGGLCFAFRRPGFLNVLNFQPQYGVTVLVGGHGQSTRTDSLAVAAMSRCAHCKC